MKCKSPSSSAVTQTEDDNRLWGWGCSSHDNKQTRQFLPQSGIYNRILYKAEKGGGQQEHEHKNKFQPKAESKMRPSKKASENRVGISILEHSCFWFVCFSRTKSTVFIKKQVCRIKTWYFVKGVRKTTLLLTPPKVCLPLVSQQWNTNPGEIQQATCAHQTRSWGSCNHFRF